MATPSPIPQTEPEAPVSATDNVRGIAWILTSVVGSSVMSVAVRELSASMDSRMIVLLRAVIILAILVPMLAFWPGFRARMRFSRPWLHVWRGVLIGVSTHLGFYTLAHVPLATATVLFFTAPIFATILAVLVHGEQVGVRRWSAVGAGFVGALIILRPGFGELDVAMLAALASSALFAIALTMSRGVSVADGPAAAYVSSVVITVLITLPVAMPSYSLPLTGFAWAVTAILVIGGAVRGVADIEAYRYGEAALLAPLTYLRLVLVGAAAFAFYGEVPDRATLIGAAIIIAATLYITRRKQLKSRG